VDKNFVRLSTGHFWFVKLLSGQVDKTEELLGYPKTSFNHNYINSRIIVYSQAFSGMQNKNNNKTEISSHLDKITKSLVNLVNSIILSFKLSERENKVDQQRLHNFHTHMIIQEKQAAIDAANQDFPVLLSSQSRLIVLEALLVARARNGQPIDDLVKAIEVVRQNILEIELLEKQQNGIVTPVRETKESRMVKIYKYDIPVLREIGYLIRSVQILIFFMPLIGFLGIFVIGLITPQICTPWENISGKWENKSAFCQGIRNFSLFFSDYQKVPTQK
jgi:hypothetical protein